MNLISIVFTFAILMIILNPQIIFGAYAPDEVEIKVTTDKSSYKHDDILTIKGSGAHSYTVFAEIIDPNGNVITKLMFIAGNNGDFSTAWIIPSELQEGKFTVHVWDILKESKTTFYLGNIPHSQEINYESIIPEWIKNNAGWWADSQIDDDAFVQGIQFLIKEGLMKIPATEQGSVSQDNKIPDWIKNNAGWWADGQIDDDAFVSGIQYLVKNGIIDVK